MVEIKRNDGALTTKEMEVMDKLTTKVIEQLKKQSIVRIPSYQTAFREHLCRMVGLRFKKEGYFAALDYVPNGFRNLIVAKVPIPQPSGRLVSIEFL